MLVVRRWFECGWTEGSTTTVWLGSMVCLVQIQLARLLHGVTTRPDSIPCKCSTATSQAQSLGHQSSNATQVVKQAIPCADATAITHTGVPVLYKVLYICFMQQSLRTIR